MFFTKQFNISFINITDGRQLPFTSFVEGFLSVHIFMSHFYVTDVLGDGCYERILALQSNAPLMGLVHSGHLALDMYFLLK